jgi:endonuclease YncB( thermonuclease family)
MVGQVSRRWVRAALPAFAAAWLAAAGAAEGKAWREYTGCKLLDNPANDGDSFHVTIGSLKSAKAKHKLLRLYFVDTPESEGSLPDRLELQRKYWGLADAQEVIHYGKMAHHFTEEFLKDGFTVYSKLDDALGRSKMDRDTALVVNAKGEDLATALVRNGLARVGGFSADLRELEAYKCTADQFYARLKKAEKEAKKERKGCWAGSPQQGRFVSPVFNRPALGGGTARPGLPAAIAGREKDEPKAPAKPAAQPAPAPRSAAPQAGTPVAPQQAAPLADSNRIFLKKGIPIYSTRDPMSTTPLQHLDAHQYVTFLEGVTATRARIRFQIGEKNYEALADFADLGMDQSGAGGLVTGADGGTWGSLRVNRSTPIYRLDADNRPVVAGHVPPGTVLKISGNLNPNVVRVSFDLPNGRTIRGMARVVDLRQ